MSEYNRKSDDKLTKKASEDRVAAKNAEGGSRTSQDTGLKTGIDKLINQDRVVIFQKSTCPYCEDAKKVFDKLGQSYSTVELTDHPNRNEVQSTLKEMTGASTVPRVFVDGVCIGGGCDTMNMYKNGRLEEILQRSHSEDSVNNNRENARDNQDQSRFQ